ncbi:replication initiation protein [Psychrobacter sp. 4Bb]|uniref:replication initiation protein n=2 Tax=unclassified Psychrobacter TaxID=196806 RepID=UPI000C7E6457|nr:replication initiation protein [Psychrobacter sp. 4Bb]PKH82283.1 RepB family plasmid replication initiator protein [Psychrobacter sp. 4Bb]
MKNNLVVQSNDLILATYTMQKTDKELMLACVSQIDSRPDAPQITQDTEYKVSVDDIKSLFFGKNSKNEQNIYRDIENASKRLYDVDIVMSLPENKILQTRLVSSIVYDPDNGEVVLSFASKILPYLTQLKANFTKYRLLEIGQLSSIHSIRMYELVVMWVNQFQYSKEFTIEEFKHVMSVKNKYKQFSELRRYVIEVAINDVNENTNYRVSVEYKKKSRGKGYTGLILKFHKKTLDKLTSKDGTLSPSAIQSIVDSVQFMNDYNDHPSISYEGKQHIDVFKREMVHIIQREPESFNKPNKGLESYLPNIKQGV